MKLNFSNFKNSFKKKKTKIITGIIIILAVFLLYSCGKGDNKDMGIPVSSVPVENKDIEETITLKSPLQGSESVEIVSKLHYEVLKINVKEGDKVKKGDILAELDTSSLEKEIETMTDSLNIKKASLNENLKTANNSLDISYEKLNDNIETKQREYESALQKFNDAKRNFENIKVLFQNGAESKESYIKAENEYNDSKRTLDSYNVKDGKVIAKDSELKEIITSNSGVNIINGKATPLQSDILEIQNQERMLENKKEDLEDCKIKSTIDGTITRVNIKTGRFADSTDDDKPMFVIENIDNLEMKVLISEYDIYKIKEGQKVDISATMIGENTAKGEVTKISPTGELKTGTTNERVIPATITLSGEKYGLIAGITAKAKINISKSENTLVAPIETVLEREDGTKCVFVIDETNKIKEIKVKTGVENDIDVELISTELKNANNLVLSPTNELSDGMNVMVLNNSPQNASINQ